MSMKLYEVSAELETALARSAMIAEENEGIIPDSLSDEIDALQLAKEGKLLACGRAYKNRFIEAEAIKLEIKRLSARAKTLENSADWLKEYMQRHCKPGEKVSDECVALSWRKSSAVEIIDAEAIPDYYNNIVVTPSKSEIKKAIVAGKEVPGAKLVEKDNLQIK